VKAHQRPPSLLKGLLRVMPVLLVTNAFAIDPYPGEGHPVIGASVIATGGDVKATFISVPGEASAFYYDYVYVEPLLPGNPDYSNGGSGTGETHNFIFVNHGSTAGQVVDLGTFPAGTELVFHVVADTSGRPFGPGPYLDWYTGPASRNADGFAHAWVDGAYTGPYGGTAVGFEDQAGLGDAGYEDLLYTFTNVTGQGGLPCDAQTATRARIDAQCDCGVPTHGEYVRCVARAAKTAAVSKTLARTIIKCAAKSTCGRSGFVACCRTNKKGVTTCSIKQVLPNARRPSMDRPASGPMRVAVMRAPRPAAACRSRHTRERPTSLALWQTCKVLKHSKCSLCPVWSRLSGAARMRTIAEGGGAHDGDGAGAGGSAAA
jgi:hypothetical protein